MGGAISEPDAKIAEIVATLNAAAPKGACGTRLHMAGTPFCPEKPFRDTDRCYWHLADVRKYEQSALDEYFWPHCTLADALEDAVRRHVNLQGAFLRDARLGGSFLKAGPNLQGAWLTLADLRGAWLSFSNLRSANLAAADLRGAKLGNCDLRDINFFQARLFRCKLRNNRLIGASGLTRLNFRGRRGPFPVDRILEDYPDQAEPMYRELVKLFATEALYEDASWAAYRAALMRHKLLSRRLSPQRIRDEVFVSEFSALSTPLGDSSIEWLIAVAQWLKSSLLLVVVGYGERPLRVVISSAVILLSFALIYCLPGSQTATDFPSSLYFSIITFSTLGYGDITPTPKFRLVAGTESLLGIVMTGLFIFCLSRRSVTRA